jgi:hypothetical protein
MSRRVASLVLALSLLASPAAADDLDQLVQWMTGAFASTEQAARDTHFLDIRLHMAPIWPERTDGRWLYVEQASARALERPYRQRVYRVLRRADGRLVSEVFALPSPLRFAGAWREPARLAALTPDSLSLREGCAVVLARRGRRFEGGTEGRGCASDLRGAAYASSEVVVDAQGLTTLDRGYDAEGRQVWGSEHGAYAFRRVRSGR